MSEEQLAYEGLLAELREVVHRDVKPLTDFDERWTALRKLVIEHKLGSEEFCLLANDINLFPKENEVH